MATPTPSKALIVPAVVTTHRLRSASASVRHSRHPPIPICGYGPRSVATSWRNSGFFGFVERYKPSVLTLTHSYFWAPCEKAISIVGWSPNPKIKEEALPRVSNQTRAWKKGRPVQNCQGGLKEEEQDTKKLQGFSLHCAQNTEINQKIRVTAVA